MRAKEGTMLKIFISTTALAVLACRTCCDPMSPELHHRLFKFKPKTVDQSTSAFAAVLEKFGGGRTGPCYTLVYFDRSTMSDELLKSLQESMGGAPMMLLDVTKIKFGLITANRKASSLPVVDLLSKRPETETCRVLLSWSLSHFQRGLLVLARFRPDIIRIKDTLVLSTEDKNIGMYIPELKRRIVVRKSVDVNRLNRTQLKFIVEQSCILCDDLHVQTIAQWGRGGGMTWKKLGPNVGMSGASIKVSYTPSVPNIFNTSEGVLDGLEYRMLEYASKALNFTYVLQGSTDGQWGRIVNGSWTGKVGDVVYRKADLAIGGIMYKPERSAAASYSTMFHYELWSIVCPPPSKLPLWPYVAFPFRSHVAPSVFAALFLFHVIGFLFVSFAANFKRQNSERENSLSKSIKNVFRVARSFYFRIMLCLYFWNMFYCILDTQYEEPINSSLGLLSSKKKYGIIRESTVASVLTSSLDASQRELAKNAREFSSISEGLYNVDAHGMCIVGVPKRHAESIIRSRYITRCREPALQVSAEDLHTVTGGWLMSRQSPLKGKLDPIITRLQGFGFLDKWRSDLYASLLRTRDERLPCIVQPIGPLSLTDLRLAFLLLLVGWLSAALLCLVERIAFSFLRSFNAWFEPTYDQPFSSVDRRPREQRTWAKQVLHLFNPDRDIRHDYLRCEAKLRYQIYMLLKDATEGDAELHFRPPQRRKRDKGSYALKMKQNTVIDAKCNDDQPTSNRSFKSLPAAMPHITQVQPYVPQLSRAERILSHSLHYENPLEAFGHQLLPNTPHATLCSSASHRYSLANFHSGHNRIEKETLRLIESESLVEQKIRERLTDGVVSQRGKFIGGSLSAAQKHGSCCRDERTLGVDSAHKPDQQTPSSDFRRSLSQASNRERNVASNNEEQTTTDVEVLIRKNTHCLDRKAVSK